MKVVLQWIWRWEFLSSQLSYIGLINTPLLMFGNQCRFPLSVYNGPHYQKVLETLWMESCAKSSELWHTMLSLSLKSNSCDGKKGTCYHPFKVWGRRSHAEWPMLAETILLSTLDPQVEFVGGSLKVLKTQEEKPCEEPTEVYQRRYAWVRRALLLINRNV